MAISLVEFYYKLVIKGKMTIEEVPEKWRAAVQAKLNKEA